MMLQSFSYLSVFKEFLFEERLNDQLKWTSVQKGPDCNPKWVCTVFREHSTLVLPFLRPAHSVGLEGGGIALGEGEGPTRKASEESAARNVAANWGR